MTARLLPHLSFSAAELEERDRTEAWRHTFSSMFEATPMVAPRDLRGRMDVYHLGQIMIGGAQFPRHRFRRNQAWASRSGVDHYFLQLYASGGYSGALGRRNANLRAGDVEVLHMGQTFDTRAQASRTRAVMIPKDLLDDRIGSVADLHGTVLKRETGAGALLGHYLRMLGRLTPRMTVADAPIIVEGCLATVAAALRPTADALNAAAPQVGAVLADRVLRHIEANLRDPALTADSLCARFRLSRSYLYRLMEPFGGVARYIRGRRLRLAMTMLNDPQGRSRRVADVAYACGFADEKTFGRAFRAEFAMTPSEARDPSGPAADVAAPPDFSRWLVGLGRSWDERVTGS
jgi:AraC-like DNA-binding protein